MMPVPNDPELSEVQDEFDAPTSAKLSAFYRGGSYVPDTSVNSGVPESGELFLSDLIGASATSNMTLTISGDPTPNGACTGANQPCTATTDSITCTASGGSSPYTITTEKRPNYTDFVVIEGVQGADSRTFEYRTTNTDSSVTYSSEYRIKVVDSTGAVAYTAYFAVSNIHTYDYSSLVLDGDSSITASATSGGSPTNSYGTYTVTGGGSGVLSTSTEYVSGSIYQSAETSIIDKTQDGFRIQQGSGVNTGGGSWSTTWVIRVTASRNGKTGTKDVTINVSGTT
tara:strand:+ start:13 stop:864 length:852 start_codon:yes stop_codon:yes gene_type:complete